MNTENNISERIKELTREIGLPGIRSNFSVLAGDSLASNSSYQEYLLQLLEMEYTSRLKRRKTSRIRQADFPYKKYLEDLQRKDLPEDVSLKLPELETLEFIEKGRNIVLAGNPGTGKTHIAIGIGIKACINDYKVLFTTVPRLLTQIKECRSERTLSLLENRFQKYDLVICDEFGYISFDKEGAELLFSHLSLRAGMKSTIITTNLPFNKWDEIFGDKVLTTALVDRLTHKAYIVNMNGKSYRTKETIQWNK